MAKGSHQKLKLLYMAQIFARETDEKHGISTAELINRLDSLGIGADRKTIYQDIAELQDFGFDIVYCQDGRTRRYYLGSRDFELVELKLMVDSVQSAKFISEKKSAELIKKLESLTSRHEAGQLHRQVIISGRAKTKQETVYYSVDTIHSAIGSNRRIGFYYFQWNEKKQAIRRHDGQFYHISPWALIWDDEFYYLIGYDADAGKMKHYRVDKMQKVTVEDAPRDGAEIFKAMDLAEYSQSLFGMFGGEEVMVTLECDNSMAGVMIDRFGEEISLIPEGPDKFHLHVPVSASRQFLGWVISLGAGVRIIAPESAVESMREEIRSLSERYSV